MAEFPNPPVVTGSAPTDGQVVIYQASSNTWVAATASTAGITVPGAHIAAASAPAAVTSSQNATTNAAVQSGSYVQADVQTITTLANALKVSYNAAQVDIAALQTELAALTTKYNTLLTELQTAGILS
jgi:hypothetical protein